MYFLKEVVAENAGYSVQELSHRLNIPKSTVHEHLKKIGYVNRYDVWIPHTLSPEKTHAQVSACDSLLKRNEESPFLKWHIAGDEKWILYSNIRKRSYDKVKWTSPRNIVKRAASQTSNSFCMVRLKRCYLLWIVDTVSGNKFWKTLFLNGNFEN